MVACKICDLFIEDLDFSSLPSHLFRNKWLKWMINGQDINKTTSVKFFGILTLFSLLKSTLK